MKTRVYVSSAGSGEIRVLDLDRETGALVELQRLAVGGQVMPMSLGPDRRFLYAARRSDPLEVLSFAIDAASGELALIGAAPLPHSMAYLATDRTGRWLFSASYGGNLVAVGPIDVNGVAQAAQQVIATGPHAHAIRSDPTNRHVFATSLGGGVVMQMRFDAFSGALTDQTPATLSPHPGASPRHFVFGPGARFVYLLGELDAKLDVLALDAATGTLRTVQTVDTLPPGFGGEPWAADLHLTPDGRFLYSSERRSSTLAAFRVDRNDGTLAKLGHTPTEAQPRSFAIAPDGRFLIAAGQASHRLAVHAIDPGSGALRPCGVFDTGEAPGWVEVLEL